MIILRIIGISFIVIIFIIGCSSGDWDNPTGNTSDPRIISVIPPRSADGVSLGSEIVAFFSEDMDSSTINNGSFYLTPSAAGTVSYNATQKAAVFTPVGLSSDTNYIATVTTGVKDTSGRAMLTGYSWSFSTKSQSTTHVP
ncbi:MAG: Ig-like domain-containing protein [Nitrospirota bacterium]